MLQEQLSSTCVRDGEAKIRVLVVDRQPLVRRGIRAVCATEPDLEICGEAGAGRSALELFQSTAPDVVVVEAGLQEPSGVALIQAFTRLCAAVALVPEPPERAREDAAGCGVHVLATGPDAVARLLAAIRSARSAFQLDRSCPGCELCSGPPAESLTNRELEVLEMLSRGFGSRRIAETLHLSQKTVETHREHLKRKLGIRSASELIAWSVAWARGGNGLRRSPGGHTSTTEPALLEPRAADAVPAAPRASL